MPHQSLPQAATSCGCAPVCPEDQHDRCIGVCIVAYIGYALGCASRDHSFCQAFILFRARPYQCLGISAAETALQALVWHSESFPVHASSSSEHVCPQTPVWPRVLFSPHASSSPEGCLFADTGAISYHSTCDQQTTSALHKFWHISRRWKLPRSKWGLFTLRTAE